MILQNYGGLTKPRFQVGAGVASQAQYCNRPHTACGIETIHEIILLFFIYSIAIDLIPLAVLKRHLFLISKITEARLQ